MKIIKNAFIYSVSLPAIENMIVHLAERPFVELGSADVCRGSFVPNETTGELVTPIGGDAYSFRFRWDEKIVPAAAIRARTAARVAELEAETDSELDDATIKSVREAVIAEMVSVAFTTTKIIDAFYLPQRNYLFVNCSSAPMSDRLTGALVAVVGSIKSSTIHISDLKMGLTTRLKDFVAGTSDAFGEFGVNSYVRLKDAQAEKGQSRRLITLQMDDITEGAAGLDEGINKNLKVESIGLSLGDTSFRLTEKFQFKQLSFAPADLEESDDVDVDAAFLWRATAGAQAVLLAEAVAKLCDLMGYVPPAEKAETEAASEEVAAE